MNINLNSLLSSLMLMLFGGGIAATAMTLGAGGITETEYKWQWLYKYATKVFTYLKKQNIGGLVLTKESEPIFKNKQVPRNSNLISWLKEEFSLTNHTNLSQDWTNFKEICKQQIDKENKTPASSDPTDNIEMVWDCLPKR